MALSLDLKDLFFPAMATLLVIFLAVKIFGIHDLWSRKKKRYHPIAGTFFHQLLNFKRLNDYLTDISRKHRTFRLYVPFRNKIYTTDPAIVEHILKNNFSNYGKGEYNHENMKEVLGDGIFSVDGAKWRHQRKLASYEFSTRNLKNFSCSVFKKNATKLASMISEKACSHETMDIQELFRRSTMDSIFKIGFGTDLNCLHGSSEGIKFTEAFDNASSYIIMRFVDVFWKIKRFLNLGHEAKLKEDIKVVNEFVYKLIHAKKEQMSNGISYLEKKEDILSRFMTEMERDPENITTKYLRDITLNFLIAGKDTTAGTLSWFIYMLCKHPLVQEKVFQEVKQATATGENIHLSEFADKITEEALDKMTYLRAALSETLRLYPTVPFDAKVCFSDDTLPDGFNVNKGDAVIYLSYPMGRMQQLWGDDAEIFRPERWIDDGGSFRPESPFKFTAFQAGPRTCIGMEFAYRQMKIFAAVLLRFFKFELNEKSREVHYKTMMTLHIDQGLHVHSYLR